MKDSVQTYVLDLFAFVIVLRRGVVEAVAGALEAVSAAVALRGRQRGGDDIAVLVEAVEVAVERASPLRRRLRRLRRFPEVVRLINTLCKGVK